TLAILGEVNQSLGDAVAVVAKGQLAPGQPHLAGDLSLQAADAPHDLAAAGADQAAQTDDLALAHNKGNVAEPSRLTQSTNLEDAVVDAILGTLLEGIEFVHHPPHHGAHYSAGHRLVDVHRGDVPAVAEYRNAVAIGEDFGHAMRDIDDRNSLRGQPVHDF